MKLINIKHPQQVVSFKEAVINPLGKNKGLYLPQKIKPLKPEVFTIENFQDHSQQVLSHLIGDEIDEKTLSSIVAKAFNFPIKLKEISQNASVLELFHGPTFAFKDFGARFLAQCLNLFHSEQKTTIITATSGDTGAAVAHAFYGLEDVEVVVLYPHNKISREQEQLFCTLGNNIHTIAIKSDFDACQKLLKQAFSDQAINTKLNLSSANSINIARLLAQACYYTFLPNLTEKPIDFVSVPSGNFGNLTAGIIAQTLGSPIKHFIAATNSNDTVPRYLETGVWQPNPTQKTLSNAMDVAEPNNFPRIQQLQKHNGSSLEPCISSISINEQQTLSSIQELYELSYLTEPHTAVAYCALKQAISKGQSGIFLSTAHPAKFSQAIEQSIHHKVPLPKVMHEAMAKKNLSSVMSDSYEDFKSYLLALNSA